MSPTATLPSVAGELHAVSQVPARIVAAWAAHDAEAFAEVFVEDGTMILPGVYRQGRDQIAGFMRQAFAGPYRGTRVAGTPFDVRFLTPDVAIVLTEGGVIPPGFDEPPAAATIRASWLLVRRAGGWHLAAYQNSPRD